MTKTLHIDNTDSIVDPNFHVQKLALHFFKMNEWSKYDMLNAGVRDRWKREVLFSRSLIDLIKVTQTTYMDGGYITQLCLCCPFPNGQTGIEQCIYLICVVYISFALSVFIVAAHRSPFQWNEMIYTVFAIRYAWRKRDMTWQFASFIINKYHFKRAKREAMVSCGFRLFSTNHSTWTEYQLQIESSGEFTKRMVYIV